MSKLRAILPELVEIRHDIHAHPELGFEEFRTSGLVRRELESIGYTVYSSAETGLWADVRPDLVAKGGTVALRADLDCLPMQEHTPLPYRSTHDGRAHKCGHDGHTTILIGVARVLFAERDKLKKNVRLIFQPAEEGVRGGGAKVMVAQGVLDQVEEIYGLHNWPAYPLGQVRVAPGPVMAEVCDFDIEIDGKGGHASQPQDCRDPLIVAAAFLQGLDGMARHCAGSRGGGVISVGQFNAGEARNVIPGTARMRGTMRFVDDKVGQRMKASLESLRAGLALAYGVQIKVLLKPGYPILNNAATCVDTVREAASNILGASAVSGEGLPMAGAEDFAYFAQERPAAYFFLGAGRPGEDTPGCHHPNFDFEDELIESGTRIFCEIVRLRCTSP